MISNKFPFSIKLRIILFCLLLIGLLFNGCLKNTASQSSNNNSEISIAEINNETIILSENDDFDKLLINGKEDKTDLSIEIKLILNSKGIIESVNDNVNIDQITDSDNLQKVKWAIKDDETFDVSKINGLKVFDIKINVLNNSDFKHYYMVFIQLKEQVNWIFWTLSIDDLSSKADRSISELEYKVIVDNGIADSTDLLPNIQSIFTLDQRKKSDSELVEYNIIEVTQITDEIRLLNLKDIVEGDEALIPTKINAIKIFLVSTNQKYQPPRDNFKHSDFLIMFVQMKNRKEWIYWGSYI